MLHLLTRFLCEERGQDVIEYALLSALIGVVGVIAWENISVGVKNAYLGWDTGVQGLWSPPDPAGGGS